MHQIVPLLRRPVSSLNLLRFFASVPGSNSEVPDVSNGKKKVRNALKSYELELLRRTVSNEKFRSKEVNDGIVAKLMPKALDKVFSGRTAPPTSMGFSDPRNLGDWDPEIDLREFVTKSPGIFCREFKRFVRETKERYPTTLEKPDAYKTARGSLNTESKLLYSFDSDESMKLWNDGADSDWSEGYSKCQLYRSDRNTGIFEGTLNMKVVKDGKTKRTGWCGMKTNDRLGFGFKKIIDINHYSHLLIKCRGDGRSYKVMLHSPEYADLTWGDSHSYPLHTHGGPYWQYERIPLSRFFHTVAGRIQDRQYSVRKCRISSIGIVLMDRIDGDFRLELDFIALTHDTAHREKFAYETYQLPVLSVAGF